MEKKIQPDVETRDPRIVNRIGRWLGRLVNVDRTLDPGLVLDATAVSDWPTGKRPGDLTPDQAIGVFTGEVGAYNHLPTPLDDSPGGVG